MARSFINISQQRFPEFGGVVPVSSRKHIENMNLIIQIVLDRMGITFKDIDLIGVT